VADAEAIKTIEARTNHDVKAMEYWLKDRLAGNAEVMRVSEFIHFGCTSEDINNVSHALMLKDAVAGSLLPANSTAASRLRELAHQLAELPMLARTHGQPATPTTLGKEMANIAARLMRARKAHCAGIADGQVQRRRGQLQRPPVRLPGCGLGGFNRRFIESLASNSIPTPSRSSRMTPWPSCSMRWPAPTPSCSTPTAISGMYISLGYFKQKLKAGEIGSSTMPHKVNPIDFENSEGNLGLANALLRHLSDKLPVSRLQRDLTDSTVLRNMGVAFGYTLLAFDSCCAAWASWKPTRSALPRISTTAGKCWPSRCRP
jgi:adenylosuccinate lyase